MGFDRTPKPWSARYFNVLGEPRGYMPPVAHQHLIAGNLAAALERDVELTRIMVSYLDLPLAVIDRVPATRSVTIDVVTPFAERRIHAGAIIRGFRRGTASPGYSLPPWTLACAPTYSPATMPGDAPESARPGITRR